MTPARERLLLVGLAGVLVLPLAVGLVALREPTWFPVLDLAMTEYRVRDVFSSHPPLIGLPGRIGRTLAEQGSHPGPLSFYLVAPVHRLLGSTAWAMQVATVVIHAGAVVTALLIARRRGGSRVAGAVAVALALLLRGYGVTLLTQPWNPYLPVLWWVVLLLAVWSVLDGDLPMLPVAVFAASLCAQTHVPYLALSLGLGAVAVVGAVPALRRDRSSWRWAAGAAVLGLVLWAPPIVEQVRHGDDGNLARLLAHFGDPPQESAGLGTGVELVLQHLDLTDLVADDDGALEVATAGTTGPAATGVVVLMAWLGAVGLAWRTRHRALMRLHAVVAAGLLLGVVSISRIFGNLWWYLMLWAWGVALLAASATVWSLRVAVGRRLPDVPPAGLAGLAVVLSAWFAVEAVDAEPPAARLSAGLGAILPATVDALESGVGGATGRDGNYVVAWRDAAHIGSQAYGLVSELERRGYRAGMTRGLRVPLTDARVIDPANATIELHFATGVNIDRFRRDAPSATEVVALDPRTPAERREFESLRRRAARDLRAAGLHDVVGHLEGNLFAASIDPRVGSPTRERIARLVELGLPLAVFVAPAGTSL